MNRSEDENRNGWIGLEHNEKRQKTRALHYNFGVETIGEEKCMFVLQIELIWSNLNSKDKSLFLSPFHQSLQFI